MHLRCVGQLGIRLGHEAFASFSDEIRFMLARASSLRLGTASRETPLFYWAKRPTHRRLLRGGQYSIRLIVPRRTKNPI
jgi:hypothetical protein